MASVTFEHIAKRYGDVPVIKDLSLEIADKEFLVLVGPSGCGKSTALRMIAGLEEVTDGTLRIGDRVVNDVHPKDRDIAMVFQNYALYPHMTCRENMGFALKLRGIERGEIEKRVTTAAKSLAIDHLLDRKPKALSGGQRQRIAIGRAVVREPQVFLMDEPLSNLDAKLRVSMRAEIKRLHQRLRTTFVYVTHDQTEAMTLGDRICVLKGGDIMQIDTPHVLYNAPANLFVATFIGSPQMNVLAAECVRGGGSGPIVKGGGFAFGLTERPSLRAGKVKVGVRPEHLRLATEAEKANGGHALTAKVEVVEPMGAETYLYLDIASAEVDEHVIARVPEEVVPKVGATATFTADPAKIHVFDAETGLRLT